LSRDPTQRRARPHSSLWRGSGVAGRVAPISIWGRPSYCGEPEGISAWWTSRSIIAELERVSVEHSAGAFLDAKSALKQFEGFVALATVAQYLCEALVGANEVTGRRSLFQ
jgi:hypothetical protein